MDPRGVQIGKEREAEQCEKVRRATRRAMRKTGDVKREVKGRGSVSGL